MCVELEEPAFWVDTGMTLRGLVGRGGGGGGGKLKIRDFSLKLPMTLPSLNNFVKRWAGCSGSPIAQLYIARTNYS